MPVLQTLKSWGKAVYIKTFEFVGALVTPTLVKENEKLREDAELALAIIHKQEKVITGLTVGYGLLQEQAEKNTDNALVTIASLLTVAGGEVTVTDDTLKAVQESTWVIDSDPVGDATTLKLSNPPEDLEGDEDLEDEYEGDDEEEVDDAEFVETQPKA